MTNFSQVAYSVKRSRRARQARLMVRPNGDIQVTLPWRFAASMADRIIAEKRDWITAKQKILAGRQYAPIIRHTKKEYLKEKEISRRVITEMVELYQRKSGFVYHRLAIRNQSTRWGSCSKTGNLNFNYRLLYVPTPVREYVIVHELCHLRHFNHSKSFWKNVEELLPDYRTRKKLLRHYRLQ